MYTREESSRIRQKFWTTFERYMNPVPPADGGKVNWINYHTHVRDVHFRMNADGGEASISITPGAPRCRHAGIIFLSSLLSYEIYSTRNFRKNGNGNCMKYDSSGRLISRIYTHAAGPVGL